MPSKITAEHPLVKEKVAAGLPVSDAIEVAERQLAHDEALAEREEEIASAKKAAKAAADKAAKAASQPPAS